MKRILSGILLLGIAGLAGCTSMVPDRSTAAHPLGGNAQPVVRVTTPPALDPAIQCFADSKILKGKTVALGPWIDGTGKTNSVANGATGNYLPGTTTTLFAADALQAMGAKVQDYTVMDTEVRFRSLLPSKAVAYAADQSMKNVPDYFLEGAWASLDFSENANIDIQVDGIGGFYHDTGATVSAAGRLVEPATRGMDASSILKRSVFSRDGGVSFGRYFSNTLVTGEAGAGQQQRLQMESAQYLVTALTVDTVSRLPNAPPRCKAMVGLVLGASAPTMLASN